jgi:hypothetical protein
LEKLTETQRKREGGICREAVQRGGWKKWERTTDGLSMGAGNLDMDGS